MSNATFSGLVTGDSVSIDFNADVYTRFNTKQTYGATGLTTIDASITYTTDQSLDSICLLQLSQTTGLTFNLTFKDSGASTITTESISQTVETNPRSTAHQVLTFDQVDLVRVIEIEITGVSGDFVVGGIYPYLTQVTPTHNFDNGATIQQSVERVISESVNFSYARAASRLRGFNLPFNLLSDAEISAIANFDVMHGDYPALIRIDPASDSADKWIVGYMNFLETTLAPFNTNELNITELRSWR